MTTRETSIKITRSLDNRRRTPSGELLITYGAGVGGGLLAGLIGVTEWVVAQQTWAASRAAFNTFKHQHPNPYNFYDGTNMVRDNEWFYMTRTPVTAALVLLVCVFTAFIVCWSLYRRRDGVVIGWLAAAASQRDGIIAAWVAATIAGVLWVLATVVAMSTTTDTELTAEFVTCEAILGVIVFGTLIPLAPMAARLGVRVRQRAASAHSTP